MKFSGAKSHIIFCLWNQGNQGNGQAICLTDVASVTWVELCPVFCPAAADRNLAKALHTSGCNPIDQRAAEASFIRTQSYKSSLFAAPWPMTAHLKYLVNMVHYTKSIVIQEIKMVMIDHFFAHWRLWHSIIVPNAKYFRRNPKSILTFFWYLNRGWVLLLFQQFIWKKQTE